MNEWMNEWAHKIWHTHTHTLCLTFRPFVIIHDNTIVSTFRDWLPRMVFRQRRWKIGFPLSCYGTANRYVRLPAAVRCGSRRSDTECSSCFRTEFEFIECNISCFCDSLRSCTVITYHHHHHHHISSSEVSHAVPPVPHPQSAVGPSNFITRIS